MSQRTTVRQQNITVSTFVRPISNVLQRKCACGQHNVAGSECVECREKRLQRKAAGHTEPETAPSIVHDVLSSPGQPLDSDTCACMEPRFGHDFSNVRVHTDVRAAESARAVNALAYTVGRDIVFGTGQYAPCTPAGQRLIAHELAHTLHQGAPYDLQRSPIAIGPLDNVFEQEAERAAAGIFSPSAQGMAPFSVSAPAVLSIQRQPRPQPQTQAQPAPEIHVGVIPIREFIRHIQTIETAFPRKSPQEILTMVRSLYYGSPAGSPGFDRLIPDAPNTGAVQTCADSEGSRCEEPVGTCMCVYAHGLAMDTPQLQQAISRLRQHANENEIADNPSPYIQVGNDLIDVGHLLVGLDAILHPRTETPFRSHGLTTAPGPATWVGDVGAAMVYLKEHQQTGRKSSDVRGDPSPTVEDYYRTSMPREDLLGDVDAFGMVQLVGPQTLSTALTYYYVSESGGMPRVRFNRWRHFASANGLPYTQADSAITWTPQARQTVIERITRFANLFAGRSSPIRAMTIGISPQNWPQAGAFADRFLHDVKQGLEEEIARNP